LGRQEGLQLGKLEGQAAILERQLKRRFGNLSPSIQHQLHTATQDQLDLWAERILLAGSVEEVFKLD